MPRPKYPPTRRGVTRITQSTLEEYLRCGVKWRFSRESRHEWATVRMAVGTGVGIGAHEDNERKITTGEPAKLREIVEIAVTGYELEVETVEVPEAPAEVARGKDTTASAAREYGKRVSPLLTDVIEAESPIVAEVAEGLEIAGTPDYVTREGLGDLKTGQPWSQARADLSRQLTVYGLLHAARHGSYPRRLWIDSIGRVHGKRVAWDAHRLWTGRSVEDYRAVLEVIDAARRGMEAGICLPAPEGAWWCSAKWCPFWRRCPAVSNGRRHT